MDGFLFSLIFLLYTHLAPFCIPPVYFGHPLGAYSFYYNTFFVFTRKRKRSKIKKKVKKRFG